MREGINGWMGKKRGREEEEHVGQQGNCYDGRCLLKLK